MSECVICHKMLVHHISFSRLFQLKRSLVCDSCRSLLVKVSGGCQYCGKKGDAHMCPDCLYWEAHSYRIRNYSLYYYNEIGKSIINQIKFSGNCKLFMIFQDDLKSFFNPFSKEYVAVPVPLHSDRLLERGFNQSLFLARMLPFNVLEILEKVNNDKQSKKKRDERLSINNFRLKTGIDIKDKKIIIVDDIYTTGSTIHHIGKILLNHHAKEVISFTLFRS